MGNKKIARAAPACSDDTGERIRAFLSSMRPLKGAYADDDGPFWRGRAAVERIAASGDETPEIELADVADVLHFVASVEPLEPQDWWQDPPDRTSPVCGFALLLQALEENLRSLTATVPSRAKVTPIRPAESGAGELRAQVCILKTVSLALAQAEDAGEITGEATGHLRALEHVVGVLDRLSLDRIG